MAALQKEANQMISTGQWSCWIFREVITPISSLHLERAIPCDYHNMELSTGRHYGDTIQPSEDDEAILLNIDIYIQTPCKAKFMNINGCILSPLWEKLTSAAGHSSILWPTCTARNASPSPKMEQLGTAIQPQYWRATANLSSAFTSQVDIFAVQSCNFSRA